MKFYTVVIVYLGSHSKIPKRREGAKAGRRNGREAAIKIWKQTPERHVFIEEKNSRQMELAKRERSF